MSNNREQDNLNIDLEKAILLILGNEYLKEFESIDGLNQHRNGLNFYEWLYKGKLITKEKLDKVLEEISTEED